MTSATDRVGRHQTAPQGALRPSDSVTVTRLQRQLALALKSNRRMRGQLAELRPEYERKLRNERRRRFQEHERAELWRHRAMLKARA